MRRHKWILKHSQLLSLYKDPCRYPGLEAIHGFKQDLVRLLLTKKCNADKCRELIPVFLDYIYKLKESAVLPLITLDKTLESWSEEVARMFRFTKSNGILQGFHNKMKMISRRSYTFREWNAPLLGKSPLCLLRRVAGPGCKISDHIINELHNLCEYVLFGDKS